jgi:hypothetical protein
LRHLLKNDSVCNIISTSLYLVLLLYLKIQPKDNKKGFLLLVYFLVYFYYVSYLLYCVPPSDDLSTSLFDDEHCRLTNGYLLVRPVIVCRFRNSLEIVNFSICGSRIGMWYAMIAFKHNHISFLMLWNYNLYHGFYIIFL